MTYWTPEREAKLWRLYDEHGPDYAKIAEVFGEPVSRGAVRGKILRGRTSGMEDAPDTIVSEPRPTVCTLEELLAQAEVDLTLWEVERYIVNSWEQRPGEQLFQAKAWLKRKPGATLDQLRAQQVEDIRADAAVRPRVSHKPLHVPPGERYALELDIFDLHLGKLGWAEEVGENYDTRIAMECAQAAVRDLLWQASVYPLEQIILPLGNDYFNVDNLKRSTTGDTPQDTDTRFHLMFRRGRGLASWMIHECAKLAPVVVPVIPGNHDRQSAFCLGEVMDAEFSHDPRVTIDNSARPRKYHLWGRNLIGFCHGDEEKPADLPELMATEEPGLWAESVYREYHIGHFHHGKEKAPIIVDDKRSVTVRWIRSLSGSDRWHTGKGYLGRRGAEGFVYRKSGGLRAHLFTYPEAQAA